MWDCGPVATALISRMLLSGIIVVYASRRTVAVPGGQYLEHPRKKIPFPFLSRYSKNLRPAKYARSIFAKLISRKIRLDEVLV